MAMANGHVVENQGKLHQNVSILDFIGAKDDGGGDCGEW